MTADQLRSTAGAPASPRPPRLRDRATPAPSPAAPVAAPPGWLWRWRHRLLGGALLAAALVGGYLVWRPQGGLVANNVNDVAESVAVALAAAAAIRTGLRAHGAPRVGWLALAVGELGWLAGQAVTTVAEWGGGTAAFPGTPDVGFLVLPVGCMVCLLLVGRRSRVRAGRDVLDGLIIVVALLITAWATSVGQAIAQHQGTVVGTTVAAAYPLSDVALGATALILLFRGANRPAVLGLFTGGLGLLTLSDTAWTYLSTVAIYDPWQWTCVFWIAGFLVLGAAAVYSDGAGDSPRPDSGGGVARSGWQLALPYCAAGLALLVLVGSMLVTGRAELYSVVGLVVLVALVLTRQLLVLLEVRRLSGQLEYQAFHDPLTGLANRALFLDRLEHALRVLDRELRPLAVLFIDLDGFKTINDSLGHPAGDRALVEVAARLRACIDPGHSVARLGGDEFAVLLEGPLVDPREVADAVLTALRPAFPLDGQLLALRASVGVAQVAADDPRPTATEVLRRADVALYVAKGAGKDVVREYQPDLLAVTPGSMLDLAADLAAAVDGGRIRAAFQQIVDPRTGRLVAVEALARWTDPVRGAVPPVTFIPVAEELGLLRPLTDAVLDAALRTAAGWRRHQALADVPVSVNFAPAAVRDAELVERLRAAVARHGLPPAALIVEITETAPLAELPAAIAAVAALRDAGFGVAIDDFGAGWTSMAFLHQLPADIVKLDRDLLAGPDSLGGGGLIDSIMTLTRSLGRRIVVEGVETDEQVEALLALGCDAVQGFLYSRPVPAEELLTLLAAAPDAPVPAPRVSSAG